MIKRLPPLYDDIAFVYITQFLLDFFSNSPNFKDIKDDSNYYHTIYNKITLFITLFIIMKLE